MSMIATRHASYNAINPNLRIGGPKKRKASKKKNNRTKGNYSGPIVKVFLKDNPSSPVKSFAFERNIFIRFIGKSSTDRLVETGKTIVTWHNKPAVMRYYSN